MKMLMENWNQFINEGDEDETIDFKLKQLEQELEKRGLPAEVADDVADAVKDEEKSGRFVMGLHAPDSLEEAKMPRVGDILAAVGVATFADAVMAGYEVAQTMGATAEGVGDAIRAASLPGMGAAAVLVIAGFVYELATQKPKNPYKDPMREEMKEMSNDEEEILDLLQNLSAPDIVVALVNWVKGGKHTMGDLQMHLGKMMSENIDEEKLTKAMKKEKEKVVKGMKKSKKDFKKRYGDDAESVMYATATKIAKEKK